MPILFFLILAGIWAVYLLPQLFEGRRSGTSNTLRNMERSTVLANIAAHGSFEALVRRRALIRRQRTLLALGSGAVASLVVAIVLSSTQWLFVAFGFDFALAGYVTMLLSIREQRFRAAQTVVPLTAAQPSAAAASTMRLDEPSVSVRVVAG